MDDVAKPFAFQLLHGSNGSLIKPEVGFLRAHDDIFPGSYSVDVAERHVPRDAGRGGICDEDEFFA